jgi:hypothetical protein
MQMVGKLSNEHFGFRDVINLSEHGLLFVVTSNVSAK